MLLRSPKTELEHGQGISSRAGLQHTLRSDLVLWCILIFSLPLDKVLSLIRNFSFEIF